MKSILIVLPQDRTQLGQLSVQDDEGVACFGPIPCLGKSDNAAAIAHDNPTRDPRKPFGDTPTGVYIGVPGKVGASPQNIHSYGDPDQSGQIPVLWLNPKAGDGSSEAEQRQKYENESAGHPVDMGLAVHSGQLAPSGEMRVTHGCVRIEPSDRAALLAQIAGLPSLAVTIEEKDSTPS